MHFYIGFCDEVYSCFDKPATELRGIRLVHNVVHQLYFLTSRVMNDAFGMVPLKCVNMESIHLTANENPTLSSFHAFVKH